VTFQGLVARKISARFRGKFAELGYARFGSRRSRRAPPARQSAIRGSQPTKLYDRTSDEITLDQVERIAI
jgi:hypothetical protein